MKSTVKTFGLGVALTAMTLGAVTYVNASGNSTIRACANKKTGNMRLITKGKCKKTERTLSWNQQGPQGVPGIQGVPGNPGAAGAPGTSGTSAVVIDATGTPVGALVGVDYQVPFVTVLWNENLWGVRVDSYGILGIGITEGGFSDSSCSKPLITVPTPYPTPSKQITYEVDGTFYVPSLLYATWNDMSKPIYKRDNSSCVLTTLTDRQNGWDRQNVLYSLKQVTPPTYTAPLTIASG